MAFSFISDLWNKWNIRGFIVLSLSLQVFLILFAPFRKKTADHCIIFLLWLAYLMADSVAAFAVGVISHNQGNSNTHVAEVDGALQAFWASFLLLHLGGPDTITAFSLEDSSLWKRHLLSLIFQVGAAIYVFVRIFPRDTSLVIPTILVFLAGVIKIAERTSALYLSSLPKLTESMLSDNEQRVNANLQLLEEINVVGDGYENSDEEKEEAKLDESIMVKHAYSFFQIFKIFIADLIYTKEQRKISMDYFNKASAVDALRVISVELNFIYEELYTKALTIRHKLSYIFRIIAFTSIAIALGLFNRSKKYRFPELDVKISHILLFGGIIIDGIALLKLVFSDWTIAKMKETTTGSCKLDAFLHKLVSTTDYLRKPRYTTCEVEPNSNVTYEVFDTPLIFQRWSESISACNLFSEALKERPRKICKCNRNQFRGIVVFKNIYSFTFQMVDKIISRFLQFDETIAKWCGKRSMIANAKYVSKNLFMKKLWIFIINCIKELSDSDDETILAKKNWSFSSKELPGFNDISRYVNKANMHKNIIVHHIATEIWYNIEKSKGRNDEREFSKILSDYMLYLLLNQPNLMSAMAMVGIAQKISTDVLGELQGLIGDATKDLKGICEILYNGEQDGMARRKPSNRLKSPLNEGLLLAHQLEGDGESKWEEMSHTWLILLRYAALNIKGETHVQVLSKGGELVTFVWLLMAHLGCFYKPEWGLYREYWEEMYDIEERGGRDDGGDGDAGVVHSEDSIS